MVSVRLSVCLSRLLTAAGRCGGQAISIGRGSTALSSKREQCRVISRRRMLTTQIYQVEPQQPAFMYTLRPIIVSVSVTVLKHSYRVNELQLTAQLLLQLLLHSLNGLFSRTTWVSRYQKGKTSLDLNEARDDGVWGWQWHQLDHMQTTCTSLQRDNRTSTSSANSYRPGALPDAQPTASKHCRQKQALSTSSKSAHLQQTTIRHHR